MVTIPIKCGETVLPECKNSMKAWDEKLILDIAYKGNYKGKRSRRPPKTGCFFAKNGEKQRKTLKSGDFKVDSLAGAQGLELQRKPDSSFEHYSYL